MRKAELAEGTSSNLERYEEINVGFGSYKLEWREAANCEEEEDVDDDDRPSAFEVRRDWTFEVVALNTCDAWVWSKPNESWALIDAQFVELFQ